MKRLFLAMLSCTAPAALLADSTIAEPRYTYVFAAPTLQIVGNGQSYYFVPDDSNPWHFQISLDGYLRPYSCSAGTTDNCALQNAGDDPNSHYSTYPYDQRESPFNGDEYTSFQIVTDPNQPNLYGPQISFGWEDGNTFTYTFEGTMDFWSAAGGNFGSTPPDGSGLTRSFAYYDDPIPCNSCSVSTSVDGVPLTPGSNAPEPRTAGLLMLGMGGLCCTAGSYRRRQMQRPRLAN